jgi:hypothetical protein
MFRNILLLVAGLTLGLWLTIAYAAGPRTDEASRALDYIMGLQNADGGFPAFGVESTPGSTLDALFALKATGQDPDLIRTDGSSPFDYLETHAAEYASDPGAAAKLALGAALFDRDLLAFGGVDLLAIMDGNVDAETGAYGLDLFDECFYILALAAADEPVPDAVYQHLHSSRAADGGWEFTPGSGSDANTTSMVLQALVAAGAPDDDHGVAVALGYIGTAQNEDGGFGFAPGEDSDPNSTALAIQAIVAAGSDVEANPWVRNGTTPLDALAAVQNPANGAVQYFGEDSAFATYQAVPALMLVPFPDLETRELGSPTPQAPTVVEITPGATSQATPILPRSGGGPATSGAPWLAVTLLAAAGALAMGTAALRRWN